MPPRTQCWACKKARLVCDATQPVCKKCAKRGHVCPGYDRKPLKWINSGRVRARKKEESQHDDNGASCSQLTGKLSPEMHAPSVHTSDEDRPNEGRRVGTPLSDGDNAPDDNNGLHMIPSAKVKMVDLGLAAGVPDDMRVAISTVEYFNSHMAPDMSAIDSPANPYNFKAQDVQYIRMQQTMFHVLVTTVLSHSLIRKTGTFSTSHAQLAQYGIYQHQGLALRTLRHELASLDQATSLMTMVNMFMLLMGELQHSACRHWRSHWGALCRILRLRGGVKTVAGLDQDLDKIMRLVIIFECISFTTRSAWTFSNSPDFSIECLELVPNLYGTGLHTCFPCPAELFKAIIYINHLRATDDPASEDRAMWLTSAGNVFNDIVAFSPSDWVEAVLLPTVMETQGLSILNENQDLSHGWLSVAHIFQSAVALYWLRSPANAPDLLQDWLPQPSIEGLSIVQLRRKYHETLMTNLLFIFSGGTTSTRDATYHDVDWSSAGGSPGGSNEILRLSKFLIWPVVIAGLEVEADQVEQKLFIIRQCERMSNMLGVNSPLDAKDLLQKFWASEMHKQEFATFRSWEDMFDKDYLFVV